MSDIQITLTAQQQAMVTQYGTAATQAQERYGLVLAGILAGAGVSNGKIKSLNDGVLVVDVPDGVSQPDGT